MKFNTKIYDEENALRKDYTKLNDSHLIVWNPKTNERSDIEDKENKILVSGVDPIDDDSEIKAKCFIEKCEFNRKFQKVTGGLLNYIDWDNVVVAGGCMSNVLNPNFDDVTDVDLFLYNLTDEEAREKILQIKGFVSDYCSDVMRDSLYVLENKYVITLIPRNYSKNEYKIQIIKRIYKNIHEILVGFDIDACAVAYNGQKVLLSNRSMNAFITRLNVVDISRRSPSYEYRLFKYHQRGFGIYIPFEFRKQMNKLYFLNRNCKGIDRLMYLLKYNRTTAMTSFLNQTTQRMNVKLKTSISDYEESIDLFKQKGSLDTNVKKYNNRAKEEFRYKLYDNWNNKFEKAVDAIEFIRHDPGQQLTGSFNPITNEDWININYEEDGIDFMGRNILLKKVRSNAVAVKDLYDKKGLDTSMFGIMTYILLYSYDPDEIQEAWNNKHRFVRETNLYQISHAELAIITDRQLLFKHIVEKEQEKYKDMADKLIRLCIILDNLEILKILYPFHQNNLGRWTDLIKKFKSKRIAQQFLVDIEEVQSGLNIDEFRSMDRTKREDMLFEMWRCHNGWKLGNIANFFDRADYKNFTIDELKMITSLRNNKADLLSKCMADFKHKINVEETEKNRYPEGSLEHYWYNKILIKLLNRENEKSEEAHNKAYSVLTHLYPEMFKLVNPYKKTLGTKLETDTVINFRDPIIEINPFVLRVMTAMYKKEIDDLKRYKYRNLSENCVRELLFDLDDLKLVECFVEKKDIPSFLRYNRKALGKNLTTVSQEYEKDRIDLKKELIYEKYADEFHNNSDHVNVLKTGILSKDYKREENIFGYTPCDYVINKILYYYNHMVIKNRELTEDMMSIMLNLRSSLGNIDRTREIIPITKEKCSSSNIENILDKI